MIKYSRKYWVVTFIALFGVSALLYGLRVLGVFDGWPLLLRIALYMASGALVAELVDGWVDAKPDADGETPP